MARDMRASIACACDADEATVIANIDNARGGKLTPMRELIAAADCSRWYEQLSAAEREEHREL